MGHYLAAATGASTSAWAYIAPPAAAIAGGFLGFLSSSITTHRAQRHQEAMLERQLRANRLSTLLPMRQRALQTVWLCLVKSRLGQEVDEREREEYLAQTVWLPGHLQALAVAALANLDDADHVTRAQTDLVQYVQSLEAE